jgi:hypothetical protein
MNWYKRAQKQLRGEWWFIDGEARYADIDIGDTSHEGMAREYAAGQIADSLFNILESMKSQLHEIGVEVSGMSQSRYDENYKLTEIFDNIGDKDTEDTGLAESIYEQLVSMHGKETVDVGLDKGGSDPIQWGLKQGWVRCKGNWLEVWAITNCAVDGLWEAYGEELTDDTLFHIDQASNRRYFEDVPLKVMEEKNPSSLLHFRGV